MRLLRSKIGIVTPIKTIKMTLKLEKIQREGKVIPARSRRGVLL